MTWVDVPAYVRGGNLDSVGGKFIYALINDLIIVSYFRWHEHFQILCMSVYYRGSFLFPSFLNVGIFLQSIKSLCQIVLMCPLTKPVIFNSQLIDSVFKFDNMMCILPVLRNFFPYQCTFIIVAWSLGLRWWPLRLVTSAVWPWASYLSIFRILWILQL